MVHAFKARLADARLLDGEVVAEVERALAEAVEEDKLVPETDTRAAQDDGQENAEEFDEAGASKYAVDAILQEHLEGQFCLPCGAGLRTPLKQWWTLLLESHNAGDWNTGSEYFEFGLATLLSESAAVDDELRRTASKALRDALLSDPQLSAQRKRALKELTSAGETEERALLLVSLAAALGTRADGMEPGDVLEFITTEDDETRAATAFMLAEARIDFEREFTGVAVAFEELDRSIRLLGMAGLDDAASLLTYEIVRLAESAYDKDGEPDENGEPLFSREQHLQVARELGAAYARQARRDFVLGLWKEADASAGKAIDLMAARLRQDWRVGNERAILLYRAFQPALKLAAQIRFLLAANETSRRELPEITERVFSDLQFAMMGETAFASQAAVQKRLLEYHGAAEALRARDDAIAALEHIEAVQAAIASSDEQLYQSRRDRARDAAAKAEEALRALLPGADTVSALAPRSLDAARAQLQPNDALLVLHSGSSNLYGFALRPSGDPFLFLSKSGADLLTEKIGRLRRDASGYGGIDIANSEDLYSRLLRPAETYLDGIDHLLVVADGQLLALPWAALSTGDGGGLLAAGTNEATRGARATRPAASATTEELAGVQWLIRKYPVSVVPGVATLDRPTGAAAGLAPFLGIGNPLLGGSTQGQELEIGALRSGGGGIDASQLAKLEPLPETADELSALAAALGGSDGNLLLGADATEDRLRLTPVGGFEVLSFATHGILAGELSGYGEPGLVLTTVDPSDPSRDGYLSLSEIMALKFNAELVILSACNTGAPDGRPRAEWMSGLTRGFIAAGAQNLLVTLWPIPSRSTVRLMTGMAHEKERMADKGWAKALQRSVLNMIDNPFRPEDRHPASWAGFVMFGNG